MKHKCSIQGRFYRGRRRMCGRTGTYKVKTLGETLYLCKRHFDSMHKGTWDSIGTAMAYILTSNYKYSRTGFENENKQ